MKSIEKIELKKIKRISPSQFFSMKNCSYKSLLAEGRNKIPLLPVSANAYYGTVLHKMLELISKGEIKSEEEFNSIFEGYIGLMEEKLIEQGYNYFVPLQKKVKDFTMKKILLKEYLKKHSESKSKVVKSKFITEKWYESKDKTIGGKIDLVIEGEAKTEILDFKTGAITQDFLDDDGDVHSEVKKEYEEQLKLYAYLYFENTGKFPTELSLVDLTKQKFSIAFSQTECKAIFEEAKSLLDSTNNCIDTGFYKANPTEANCKFCLYRPACLFYLREIEGSNNFNDISGSLINAIKFQNGNVSMYLQSGSNTITVSNLPTDMFDELVNSKTKKINVFNLRKDSRNNFYSATKTTMIYENNRI